MANRYPLIVDSSSQQIKEFPSGDTLVIDNLQVTGTTTTLETATLNVEDKNITINYSTGDSSSTADGSGLTFQDAVDASNDATILWNATNDEFDFSHGITLPDSQKITFGTGGDLEIYHDGSNTYIDDAGTGALVIRSNEIQLQKYTGETIASFIADSTVQLRYDNVTKLATTSTGIDVTGVITTDGFTSVGGTITIGADGAGDDFRFYGDTSGRYMEWVSSSDALLLRDNSKILLGNGSDLQIYHDGSDSIINEAGTGVLKIRGSAGIYIQKHDGTENLASFLHDDGVYLNDGANNTRLQTTSTGVTVTGALLEDTNRVATNGRAIAFSLIFG